MGALVKVQVRGLEGSCSGKTCTAMFNPKELQVDKTVSWSAKSGHTENPVQEFKEPQSSNLQVTLYFDGYEKKKSVYDGGIDSLEAFATIDQALGRPPLCLFLWGKFRFQGVVSSLSQKYTMFLEDGTPVRAEVGLQMISAQGAEVAAKKDG